MRHKNPQVFWRKHVQGWLQSGLIPAQYCIRHSLNEKTFSRWKIKLHGPAQKPTKKQVEPASSQLPISLIAVPVVDDKKSFDDLANSKPIVKSSGVSLKLPKSRCIDIDVGFNEDTLRRLLVVLEQI